MGVMWDGQIVGFVFEVQNHILKLECLEALIKKKLKHNKYIGLVG